MTLTYAKIKVGSKEESVQFNPASLRVTTTNQIDDEHPNQVSKPTGFKLDVELLFDTTEQGTDVYEKTRTIRDAATASAQGATAGSGSSGSTGSGRAASEPPSSLSEVTFIWGPSNYTGYIESLNETVDYFSSDGVPMRATLQLSIKGKTPGFLTGTYGKVKGYGQNPAPHLPSVVMAPAAAEGKANLLQKGLSAPGDASVSRGIAALNGMESMRGGVGAFAGASAGISAGAGFSAGAEAGAGFSAGASAGAGIAVGGGAQLQAAAGFALSGGISAGASIGFGMGASAGLSAGAGLGASVGVGMAAGMGGGIGIGGGISAGAGIGGGASAGIGVSAGIGGGIGIGGSGGGIGVTTSSSVTGFDGVTTTRSTSSVTGFDGTTTTTSSTTTSGSASAGAMASAGAFAGLGSSRTSLPPASFNPDSLLPPPLPAAGGGASYDVSGRLVSGDGQVAASYSARAGVRVW